MRYRLLVPFSGNRQNASQIADEIDRQAVACFGRRHYNAVDEGPQNGRRLGAAFFTVQRAEKVTNFLMMTVRHVRVEKHRFVLP